LRRAVGQLGTQLEEFCGGTPHSGDSGNAFIGFSPDGANRDGTFGSWTPLYPKKITSEADHNVMAIDPVRDLIVIAAWKANTLFALNPSIPASDVAPISSKGDMPNIAEFSALEYAPNLDQFVYYSANNGPKVYAIASPAGSGWAHLIRGVWKWKSLLNAGNTLNPIVHAESLSSYGGNRSHTFGRFRIATYGRTDLAILIRHVDSPVYAMRLN